MSLENFDGSSEDTEGRGVGGGGVLPRVRRVTRHLTEKLCFPFSTRLLAAIKPPPPPSSGRLAAQPRG